MSFHEDLSPGDPHLHGVLHARGQGDGYGCPEDHLPDAWFIPRPGILFSRHRCHPVGAGARLGTPVILVPGPANPPAEGFSMATGACLSPKSEREVYLRGCAREAREVEEFPDGEKPEMQQVYRSQGYTDEETEALVDIQTRDAKRRVQAMMTEDPGLFLVSRKPLMSGLVTLLSFIVAGSVPLVVCLPDIFVNVPEPSLFPAWHALAAVAFPLLGAARSRITGCDLPRSALETLPAGRLAAGVACAAGGLLRGLAG